MNSNKPWLEPDWPAPENVKAATTLRSGGTSTGLFESLNPALHVGDNAAGVIQNRGIIRQMLSLPAEPVWLKQVHSNIAIDATQQRGFVTADAAYSHKEKVVCAVLTADCLPVLLCSDDGCSVAAVHAGWRGLLAGVITHTVQALQRKDLLVWLGPAIGSQCFEVGDEVRALFVAKSAEYAAAFCQQDHEKWLADIYELARINLAFAGITRIYGGGFCTVSDPEHFYSYRRDKQTGRMATLIWRT